jgi:ribosomal protein L7/L12
VTTTTIIVAGALLVLALVLFRSRSNRAEIDADFGPPTEQAFRALLAAGRKIDAIKVYRRLHGVDLKTAKEAVDRITAELPPMPPG